MEVDPTKIEVGSGVREWSVIFLMSRALLLSSLSFSRLSDIQFVWYGHIHRNLTNTYLWAFEVCHTAGDLIYLSFHKPCLYNYCISIPEIMEIGTYLII